MQKWHGNKISARTTDSRPRMDYRWNVYTSADDTSDGIGEIGQVADGVGDEHVVGVRVAGDGRQLVAVEVGADTDRYQPDAGVSDQLGLAQRRRLVGRRVVGDDDDQLVDGRVAETSSVRLDEDHVTSERQREVQVRLVTTVADLVDRRLSVRPGAVVAEVEVDLHKTIRYDIIYMVTSTLTVISETT